MEITLNGHPAQIPESSTVQQLLLSLYPDPVRGIAVAVNQSVVSRSDWPHPVVLPQDQIMLITATQGG